MTAVIQTYVAATECRLSEIRMLGPLRVHRVDGSVVDPGDWRTGKTSDLLRMLALRAGQPVPVSALVVALWPNSDQQRGQASLRTAASQIRHTLGRNCLVRSPAGLELTDVWVDVAAFRTLAAQARRLMGAGQPASVATIAREADALYRGDLRAHDDSADWVRTERRALADIYQVLLCDAAEAAVDSGAARDGVDFASRAVAVDPFGERASRLLMRAYAGSGEVCLGLREYERCRALLAEELGVDPSPETRAVHLSLLRSEGPARMALVGGSSPAGGATAAEPAPNLGDPEIQAEARLQLAVRVCLPVRQFVRARRCAEQAARLSARPGVRARALVAAALPDILLGRPGASVGPLEQAAALAAQCGDDLLQRRLAVLQCLVAHDTASPAFEARWAHAARSCETETDVNWAWMMVRAATERGDLDTARLASQMRVDPACGPMARQLHTLATAAMLGELGQVDGAIDQLVRVVDAEHRAASTLLLPEALARLAMLRAQFDLPAAEANLAQLDQAVRTQSALPREAFLRLLAVAAIHSARGRAAAAAAAAAGAAEIAEENGLGFLAGTAHDLCAQYTTRAQALSARGGWHAVARLALTLSNAAT